MSSALSPSCSSAAKRYFRFSCLCWYQIGKFSALHLLWSCQQMWKLFQKPERFQIEKIVRDNLRSVWMLSARSWRLQSFRWDRRGMLSFLRWLGKSIESRREHHGLLSRTALKSFVSIVGHRYQIVHLSPRPSYPKTRFSTSLGTAVKPNSLYQSPIQTYRLRNLTSKLSKICSGFHYCKLDKHPIERNKTSQGR